MKVQEAAESLQVSIGTVYALCRKGEIPHMRIGIGRGTIRIEQAGLDSYLEKARARGAVNQKPEKETLFVYKHITPPV